MIKAHLLFSMYLCQQEYLMKSNKQIDEMVEVVRGKLSPGARITICALIVIDVHGKYFK